MFNYVILVYSSGSCDIGKAGPLLYAIQTAYPTADGHHHNDMETMIWYLEKFVPFNDSKHIEHFTLDKFETTDFLLTIFRWDDEQITSDELHAICNELNIIKLQLTNNYHRI